MTKKDFLYRLFNISTYIHHNTLDPISKTNPMAEIQMKRVLNIDPSWDKSQIPIQNFTSEVWVYVYNLVFYLTLQNLLRTNLFFCIYKLSKLRLNDSKLSTYILVHREQIYLSFFVAISVSLCNHPPHRSLLYKLSSHFCFFSPSHPTPTMRKGTEMWRSRVCLVFRREKR